MPVFTILAVFVFLLLLLIFLEYRNEKKYQEERRRKHQKNTPETKTTPSKEEKKSIQKPAPKQEKKPEPEPKIALAPTEPQAEAIQETKELPEADYPQFTHVRLLEMGLSDEEAKEFVAELIPQIETEIPLIEAAIQEGDFHQLEKLIHGIKGSATNLGTGGVSDLLVDFNTFVKTGTDVDIAKAYLEHLRDYTNALKAQYA